MLETYNLPGNRILTIDYDEYPNSPTSWDNIGTMICFHRKYDLGHKHNYKKENYSGWEEVQEQIEKDYKPIVILPLYLYDHSGISISTTSFGDPWDSGQVGFIFAAEDNVKRLCGELLPTKEEIYDILKEEVKIYDQYLSGDCYAFKIEKVETCNLGHQHKTIEDSCGGFYGSNIKENGILDNLSKEDREAVLKVIENKKQLHYAV